MVYGAACARSSIQFPEIKKQVTHRIECLLLINAKDNKGTITIPIVILSDGLVLILSRSVPYLHLYPHAFNHGNLIHEIYPYGHHIVVDELPLTITQKDVALANTTIPNDYYLFKHIILLLGLGSSLVHFSGLLFIIMKLYIGEYGLFYMV